MVLDISSHHLILAVSIDWFALLVHFSLLLLGLCYHSDTIGHFVCKHVTVWLLDTQQRQPEETKIHKFYHLKVTIQSFIKQVGKDCPPALPSSLSHSP